MHLSFISGDAAGVERILHWQIPWQDAVPCDGESEEELGQADNEIAAVNVDLDSVDDDGTALGKEEKLPGDEEQSIPVRPVIPFDDLDLTLISDSVMVDATRMSVTVPVDYEDSETAVPIAMSAHNPIGYI
jgi:hypothetical protein